LQSLDAAQLLNGIKRGEVVELHGDAVGAAVEFVGQRDDGRITRVQLTERQFVIKIESDQQLVARPAFAGGRHGAKIAQGLGRQKKIFHHEEPAFVRPLPDYGVACTKEWKTSDRRANSRTDVQDEETNMFQVDVEIVQWAAYRVFHLVEPAPELIDKGVVVPSAVFVLA